MTNAGNSSIPIACVVDAIPPEQRDAHSALVVTLFDQAAREQRDLSDGYEFVFPVDLLEAIASFIGNERKCCPFVNFDLRVTAGSHRVVLRMTGPPGTKGVLDAELLHM
jgi:hypothetical protein